MSDMSADFYFLGNKYSSKVGKLLVLYSYIIINFQREKCWKSTQIMQNSWLNFQFLGKSADFVVCDQMQTGKHSN